MLKSLIIIGHLIGIFFLSFLFSDEITITDTFPESLNVGENYTVTTTITKNDVTGFAKYQIEAPKGIVIKPIDLNGASFTFKDGKAKFIWMNLPTEPSFDIQYELTLENGELGSQKEVNSRFSYLVANERKIHEGPNHVLNVAGNDAVSTNVQSSGSSDISATRKITAEGDNKFLVEIDISKLGVKGFAKIQDAIPDGFIATEVMNSEAIFTQTESKVKLVWFDIPKNMNLKVSYLLEAPADFTGKASISGKFHYMAGSDLKKVDVPGQTITIGAEMVAENNTSADETNSGSQDLNATVNENMTKIDDSVSETANKTADVVTNTAQEVDGSITKKTDEVNPINNAAGNTSNDVTTTNNSTSESNEETSSFMDSFVSGQSTKTDATTAEQVGSKSIETVSNDVSNTGTNSQSNKNSSNAVSNNVINEEDVAKNTSNSNDVIIPASNNTASNSNNAANNTASSNTATSNTVTNNTADNNTNASNMDLSPTQTSDMTANVAEPESTAVATKEYVKDEVIAEEKSFSNLTNVTAADKGINYRVQIMAGKNVVGKEYLRKKHSYYSEFIIENHQGWIKYTSGDYETYKVARDQRNMIRDQYNFNGPFVSAYNDGVRITVQEALMITKQQWYN